MLTAVITMLLFAQQSAGGQAGAARGAANLDQIICRASEPVLGSRVARRRICRTRAQWQAFEEDRAQLRRDIQNAGKGQNNDD